MPPALGQGGGGRRLLGRGGGQDRDREVVHRLRLHPARRRDQRHLRGLGHGLPPARGVTDPPRPPSGSPTVPPAPLSPRYAPRGPEGRGGGTPARLRRAWSRLRQPWPHLPNPTAPRAPMGAHKSPDDSRGPADDPWLRPSQPRPQLPNPMVSTPTVAKSTQRHGTHVNHDHVYPSSWPCLHQPLDLYFNHDHNYPIPHLRQPWPRLPNTIAKSTPTP